MAKSSRSRSTNFLTVWCRVASLLVVPVVSLFVCSRIRRIPLAARIVDSPESIRANQARASGYNTHGDKHAPAKEKKREEKSKKNMYTHMCSEFGMCAHCVPSFFASACSLCVNSCVCMCENGKKVGLFNLCPTPLAAAAARGNWHHPQARPPYNRFCVSSYLCVDPNSEQTHTQTHPHMRNIYESTIAYVHTWTLSLSSCVYYKYYVPKNGFKIAWKRLSFNVCS